MLDQTVFETWLRSHDALESVGICNRPGGCPIATWLRAELGVYVFVDKDTWHTEDREFHPMPPWAKRFVFAIDHQYSYPGHEVTAYEALQTLTATLT
jgi:hypothetical protein